MKKRGQVTLFIIVGVIVVAMIGGLFLIQQKNTQSISSEAQIYKDYMQNCLEDSSIKVLKEVGQNPLQTEINYTILFDNNQSISFTREKIKKSIENIQLQKANACNEQFTQENTEYTTQVASDAQVTTTFDEENTYLNINYPVTITKGDKTYTLDEYEQIAQPIRLQAIIETIDKIITEQEDHPTLVCTTCIATFAEENDLYITINPINEQTLLLTIRDETSKLEDEYYEVKFIMRY